MHRHDKRQRHLPRDLFASIPLARALFGGKPHTNPEAAVKEAGKEDKEHNKQSKAEKEDSKAKKPGMTPWKHIYAMIRTRTEAAQLE